LAAAVINMMVLQARTNTVTFIQASRDVKLGELFTMDDLAQLPIPGTQAALLKNTAIPFENIGVLVGQPALRDFMVGDIVFFRDFDLQGETLQLRHGEVAQQVTLTGVEVPTSTLNIGNELYFFVQMDPEAETERIGPFRLVSVGDRVSNSIDPTDSSGAAKVITVAVKKAPNNDEEKTQQDRLIRFALKQQQDLGKLITVQTDNQNE
jgi:hypothetical protein